MTGPNEQTTLSVTAGRQCLMDGCSCRDTRVISTRRVAFFAARARVTGETADRVIAAESGWLVPATQRSGDS
jgi:hypothetical protein